MPGKNPRPTARKTTAGSLRQAQGKLSTPPRLRSGQASEVVPFQSIGKGELTRRLRGPWSIRGLDATSSRRRFSDFWFVHTARLKPCPKKKLEGRALKSAGPHDSRSPTPASKNRSPGTPIWRSALPFHPPGVGYDGGGLERNENANSTKQRRRVSVRCADVASWRVGGSIADQWFHPPWVGFAGGRLLPAPFSSAPVAPYGNALDIAISIPEPYPKHTASGYPFPGSPHFGFFLCLLGPCHTSPGRRVSP